MPKSKDTLNRRKNRLLDFGDRLLRGLTGRKSLTGGLISQSALLVPLLDLVLAVLFLLMVVRTLRFPASEDPLDMFAI